MASSVPADNEMLHQIARVPREHVNDLNPESSAPTTTTPAVHPMPTPEQGALGLVS